MVPSKDALTLAMWMEYWDEIFMLGASIFIKIFLFVYKFTFTCSPFMFTSSHVSDIAYWYVGSPFFTPKGMTCHTNAPQFVMKIVLYLSFIIINI